MIRIWLYSHHVQRNQWGSVRHITYFNNITERRNSTFMSREQAQDLTENRGDGEAGSQFVEKHWFNGKVWTHFCSSSGKKVFIWASDLGLREQLFCQVKQYTCPTLVTNIFSVFNFFRVKVKPDFLICAYLDGRLLHASVCIHLACNIFLTLFWRVNDDEVACWNSWSTIRTLHSYMSVRRMEAYTVLHEKQFFTECLHLNTRGAYFFLRVWLFELGIEPGILIRCNLLRHHK